ncbi:hypothetical protein BTHERMOSOX_1090 [Bathymodiolus thermophilus thioautotrophic gill symbiont]|jgi:hypothetical protein|uniref:Uncharacterized protein n=1 Tax=Bathymodiolus thermophilus thioautotrophic gill symbiont TaxID=2360 RepID=A0A3G3IMN4_9GAMM|nr:hypothetical protein [Bathymodiolus thermophilus thioautotrophic gill symbiont]AYQ57009.1 hypothetical protein MS2017_1316 [Bathymodiolus thermophilus thioautotrophic gill symbiont]CAB5497717.1 hypothetical protein THERMOT_738 [Bathymodiolus thermophilus thioautotrophic gill symbiont]CAB5505906.1 hypothetical protein THERMOS_2210 [Bathymodiolus thermophilus thioautotrophic gill symbiont]SGZ59099.1 hypothetical protein BTHERMOSOX_1090 [Bathymodiolus thermophilus thioautotrophic gill symbiont]
MFNDDIVPIFLKHLSIYLKTIKVMLLANKTYVTTLSNEELGNFYNDLE